MDRDDLELFDRSLAAATSSASGADLDAALAELGWAEALHVDVEAAVSLLFARQGAAAASSSALDQLVGHGLGVAGADHDPVVLPALGSWSPPGSVTGSGRRAVTGLGSAATARASSAVLVTGGSGPTSAVRVAVADLEVRPIGGIDPDLGLVHVAGEVEGGDPLGDVDWTATVRLAQLAVGHELVGASRRMLELAREHALDRVQFGQPIAMFQAVRHRLAETLVVIEMAQAALEAAWIDPDPHHASIAKALSGRGARTAAKHCQQVLAGIGYTTEHPFHLSLRRVLVLDELFGSARGLAEHLGRELVQTRRLPPRLAL